MSMFYGILLICNIEMAGCMALSVQDDGISQQFSSKEQCVTDLGVLASEAMQKPEVEELIIKTNSDVFVQCVTVPPNDAVDPDKDVIEQIIGHDGLKKYQPDLKPSVSG